MEYIINLSFKIQADTLEDAENQAKSRILNNPLDFVNDNLDIRENDDELLKLKTFVIISGYREKVVKSLKNNGVLIPVQIADDTGILKNHISKTLRELRGAGLIECINPEARKGKLYRLTSLGNEIGGLL